MWIEISAGYINFGFQPQDWQVYPWTNGKSAGRLFIKEMKARIPRVDRSFDDTTYTWSVDEKHKKILQELKDQCFSNPDQLSMF